MRELKIEHPCEMSAERFWALRVDEGFDHFFAELDNQICEMRQHDETEEADGTTSVARCYNLKLKENPVPPRLRNMMGKRDFAFTVRASFHKEKFDEAHRYSYSTIFPVFTDRISVCGEQWLVPLGENRCVIHVRIKLRVSISVIGPAVEKAVEKSMVVAYKDLPARALAFVQLGEEQMHMWKFFRGDPFKIRKTPSVLSGTVQPITYLSIDAVEAADCTLFFSPCRPAEKPLPSGGTHRAAVFYDTYRRADSFTIHTAIAITLQK